VPQAKSRPELGKTRNVDLGRNHKFLGETAAILHRVIVHHLLGPQRRRDEVCWDWLNRVMSDRGSLGWLLSLDMFSSALLETPLRGND